MRLRGLPPAAQPGARVLFLGSMPSAKSLEYRQYYGHPRNHFWPMVGALFGFDAALPYDRRLDAAMERGLAIWDVIRSCEREGSLDQNIRDAQLCDVPGLLARYASIQVVALNGGKAAQLYRRYFKGQLERMPAVSLPSSSPIPTRACPNMQSKLRVWRWALAPWLPPDAADAP